MTTPSVRGTFLEKSFWRTAAVMTGVTGPDSIEPLGPPPPVPCQQHFIINFFFLDSFLLFTFLTTFSIFTRCRKYQGCNSRHLNPYAVSRPSDAADDKDGKLSVCSVDRK